MIKAGAPVVPVDYMRLKGKKEDGKDQGKDNPIVVVHCRETELTWSKVVLNKGADPYSAKVMGYMIAFTRHMRYLSIVMLGCR